VQLENSFTVPVPIDEAWRVLLDIERIAPCMPGAALDSVSGDDFTGRVKVKLGPINLTYQGKASFVEKDEAAHRAVIDARGKDQRGNGTAAATITAKLAAEGSTTRVDVLTDLNITGRPAQFGRGVMTDVGNKLLGQFADKLAAQLGEGDARGDAQRAGAAADEGPVAKVAATATGAVEEIAGSVEQIPGDGAAAATVKKAAAATKKAAAGATEKVSTTSPVEAPTTTPVKVVPSPVPAAEKTAPARESSAPATAAKAPSGPPTGPSGPPRKAPSGSPVRSVPSSGPTPTTTSTSTPPSRPRPVVDPEPIDLLEVAGGAAMARYAAPAAGVAAALLVVVLLVRRGRRRRR
jgi:carbon monoxide dehydrogenase subunit G